MPNNMAYPNQSTLPRKYLVILIYLHIYCKVHEKNSVNTINNYLHLLLIDAIITLKCGNCRESILRECWTHSPKLFSIGVLKSGCHFYNINY